MRTLHIKLKLLSDDYAELRYYLDNPNQYHRRSLPLKEIENLLQLAEQDYYTSLPASFAGTGKQLYEWLDGSDRWLRQVLSGWRGGEVAVLAIAILNSEDKNQNERTRQLAHLPWEILHDGTGFLVQRSIVPIRWMPTPENPLAIPAALESPANRALQVLFMATSPLDVKPVLDFENEEAQILQATARQPLALTVEESGCLQELANLVASYENEYFDVFHLTGHAQMMEDGSRFLTETETGECYRASAADFAEALQFRLPKLIFLSGCRTGEYGKAGTVPSMAEALLNQGGKAVLAWGRPVLDENATDAAAALYGALAEGKNLAEAVARTYQALIKNQARDWHLLRLYVAGTIPGALVTPLNAKGRQPAPPPSVTTRLFDKKGEVKVATRQSFVGRRRQLQNCLRALTHPQDLVGVLIHGMGGLGKSSLAARICDRLTDFERIVWVGEIDEGSLVSNLGDRIDYSLQQILDNYQVPLKKRLQQVFRQLDQTSQKLLLVFDDFEANLESRSDGFVLKVDSDNNRVKVLEAVVWAIQNTDARHRLIITSRYDFDSTHLQYFYKQPLDALQGADLQKKCDRLISFNAESQVDRALKLRSLKLADGNPRLLEWLDKILQDKQLDKAAILNCLEESPLEVLRDNKIEILAQALLEQMDLTMQQMLQLGLVFELPVPRAGLAIICTQISDFDSRVNRAIALGLLEVSPDQTLRVPRILPLQAPAATENLYYSQAAQILYQLWWEEVEKAKEEQAREIHRLALLGKEAEIAAEVTVYIAEKAYTRGQFNESSKICLASLELIKDYRIFACISLCQRYLGDLDKAIENAQQSINLCPLYKEKEKAKLNKNLGMIYSHKGREDLALPLFLQSLKIIERLNDVREQAWILNAIGGSYSNQNKLEEALTYLQMSLKLFEDLDDNTFGKAMVLENIAAIKDRQGKADEALALHLQALELMEQIDDIHGQATTLFNMADIYSQQGRVEEALILFQRSQELYAQTGDVRGNHWVLQRIVNIYVSKGQLEQAFTLCTELNPNDSYSWNSRGVILQSLDCHEDAIADFDKALELTFDFHWAWYNRGNSLHNLQRYEEALASYEKAIKFNDSNPVYWNAKGNTLYELVHYKEAIASYEEATKLNPKEQIYQNNLNLALEKLVSHQETVDSLNKAIKLNPKHPDYWNAQGLALSDLGRYEEAVTKYDKAIEINFDYYWAWYNRGEALQELKRYEEALVSFNKVIKTNPKDYRTWNNRGNALRKLSRYEEAIADFDKAVELQSDYHWAWNNRGETLRELNRYEEALTNFDKAIELKSDDPDYWNNRGLTLHNLGNYEEALASYSKALEVSPEYVLSWALQGVLLNGLGRYKEAISSYKKAIELEPDNYLFWQYRGDVLVNLSHCEEAVTSYDKALELNPELPDVWIDRGNLLKSLGRGEEAIASYDKAIELKPEEQDYWNNRGNVLHNLGRYEEAIVCYDKVIELQPDAYWGWGNRGNSLQSLGRYQDAIPYFDKAIELKPDYLFAWNNRGNALRNLSRYEEAIVCYDKAIELNPEEQDYWNKRGNILHDLGRYEEAIVCYEKVIELKPDAYWGWYNWGTSLRSLGRYEEAISYFDEAIELKPDYHRAWNNRGNTLRNMGRYEEAIINHNKALEIQPDFHETWVDRGIALKRLDRIEEAIASCTKAIEIKQNYAIAWYNKACYLALQGNFEQTLESLKQAIKLNPSKYKIMAETDCDFDTIRSQERFQALIKENSELF